MQATSFAGFSSLSRWPVSFAARARKPWTRRGSRVRSSTRWSAAHGFDRAELTTLLDAAVIDQTILDTMSRPAERVVPWFEYRNIFMTEERIAAGVRFWTEHAATLEQVAERYGVAPEMIVAIVGIETYFGTRMGRYRVLDALATLAFAYPPRAAFFTSELEAFLLLSREEQVDPTAALGSYAGAMGAGQFIPSSYRAYAVDADADGKRDLWTDWDDVLRQRRQLLRQARLAHRRARHASRRLGPSASRDRSRATASISATPSARWPSWATCSRRRCRPMRPPRRTPSRPQAAGRSTGSATTTSTS